MKQLEGERHAGGVPAVVGVEQDEGVGAPGVGGGPADGRRTGHVVGYQDDAIQVERIENLGERAVQHVEAEGKSFVGLGGSPAEEVGRDGAVGGGQPGLQAAVDAGVVRQAVEQNDGGLAGSGSGFADEAVAGGHPDVAARRRRPVGDGVSGHWRLAADAGPAAIRRRPRPEPARPQGRRGVPAGIVR